MITTRPFLERDRKILSLRREGKTFTAIAKQYSISINRVRQIVEVMERIEKEESQCKASSLS